MNNNSKIYSLQALRAIAASLVVIDHSLLELTKNDTSNPMTIIAWSLGSAGVYAFFVLSGFIMVYVSWRDFGGAGEGIAFFRRRVIRIVPLYWVGTIVALGFHKVSETHGAQDGWRQLIYSLAFIPYRGSDGGWSPILPQGWTLNYEMMFYVIFSLGLLAPRKIGLPIVCVALCIFVFIGSHSHSVLILYLSSPIILWFVLGMALATIWKHLELSESTWVSMRVRLLEPIGDASYSLYLVHGLVLTLILRIWIAVIGGPSIFLVPLSLAGAIFAGWVTYRFVEKPLLGVITKKKSYQKNLVHTYRSR